LKLRPLALGWIGTAALTACSLTHDLDGLEGAGGGGATTSSSAASTSSAGGAGGAPCKPLTCAQISPKCGALDDGCGGPLDCGCLAPSACDLSGVCVCPPMPIVTPVVLPTKTDVTHGTGAAWTSAASATAKDGVAAHATLTANTHTMNLEVSGFGFDQLIPTDAAIQSLSILACRWKTPSTTTQQVLDSAVRLLYAGHVLSQANVPSVTPWAYNNDKCQQVKYDWIPAGQSPPLDTAHVRDPAFGAVLVAKAPSTNTVSVVADVDWIGMSIAYTQTCLPMNEPVQ
jgi:hypothetical protein